MDPNQQPRQSKTNNRGRNRRQKGSGRTSPFQEPSFDATATTNQPDIPSSPESSLGPPRITSNIAISQNVPLARMSTPDINRVVVQNPPQPRHSFQGTFNPSKSTDADELIILNKDENMSPIEPPVPTNEQSPFSFFPSLGSSPSVDLPSNTRTSTDSFKPATSPLQIPSPSTFPQRSSSESTRSIVNPIYPPYPPTPGKRDPEKDPELTPPILIPPDLHDRSCKFCNETQTDKYEIITVDGTRKIKKGRLFSPCKCTGNRNYVHVGCLKKWRQAGEPASYRCENCKYKYRFYRITLGSFLASRPLVHVLTIILLLGVLYATGWIAKVFDLNVMHDSETLPEFLLLNVWHWLIGLLVITFIGLIFLTYQTFFHGGTRGLRSLYSWACPCFVGLPGFGQTTEKKTSRFQIGLIVLFMIVFTPLGVIALISGTYVLFQRSINRILWRAGDGILNVKKRNE